MKSTLAPAIPAVEHDDWHDTFDAEDAKDVFYPHDPGGELSTAVRLRFRFEAAGYGITTVEKPSPHHPVWLIKATRRSAPQFPDDAQFLTHVHQILRLADFRLRKSDVTALQSRNRIVVCFVVLLPVPDRGNGSDF
jgi:hypothetical protein